MLNLTIYCYGVWVLRSRSRVKQYYLMGENKRNRRSGIPAFFRFQSFLNISPMLLFAILLGPERISTDIYFVSPIPGGFQFRPLANWLSRLHVVVGTGNISPKHNSNLITCSSITPSPPDTSCSSLPCVSPCRSSSPSISPSYSSPSSSLRYCIL